MKRRPPRCAVQGGAVGVRWLPVPEVIMLAVRWFLRFGSHTVTSKSSSTERGIDVDHVNVYRWCNAPDTIIFGSRPRSTNSPKCAERPPLCHASAESRTSINNATEPARFCAPVVDARPGRAGCWPGLQRVGCRGCGCGGWGRERGAGIVLRGWACSCLGAFSPCC